MYTRVAPVGAVPLIFDSLAAASVGSRALLAGERLAQATVEDIPTTPRPPKFISRRPLLSPLGRNAKSPSNRSYTK
jgi:hypothetical protein